MSCQCRLGQNLQLLQSSVSWKPCVRPLALDRSPTVPDSGLTRGLGSASPLGPQGKVAEVLTELLCWTGQVPNKEANWIRTEAEWQVCCLRVPPAPFTACSDRRRRGPTSLCSRGRRRLELPAFTVSYSNPWFMLSGLYHCVFCSWVPDEQISAV